MQIDALKIGLASSRDHHCGLRSAISLSPRSMPHAVPSSLAERCQLAGALAPTFERHGSRCFKLRRLTGRARAISIVFNSKISGRSVRHSAPFTMCVESRLRDNASPNRFYCHTDSSRHAVLKACVWEALEE
ncbi:MAG TPA: hypothetical protein VNQ74_02650 [Burkholderiaceae bacterium]|nr:hypothetical protein [Burkholderiaceae bacterium]